MTARQRPWPKQWLMTDERMGDELWAAIERLPINHGGIVVRHHATPEGSRAALARRIAGLCKRHGLTLAVASDTGLARALHADLVHNPLEVPDDLPFSRSVHSLAEAETARADGASLVFVSPVRATRSHPGRRPLERELAKRMVEAAGAPAIALGGMDAKHFPRFERDGFYGWAGIDAWLGDEVRT